REAKFNLGYQLEFSHGDVKPYLALDLMYLIAKSYTDFLGGFAGVYSKWDLREHGIGYAPTLGLHVKLAESFSISWEGNVEFLWINENGTNTRSDPHPSQTLTTYPINRDVHLWLLNPVKSISLNYGF